MSTAENPLRSGQLLVLPLAMVVGAFILWNQAEQTRKRGDPENSCLNHSANGVRNGNGGRANSYTRTVDVPPQLTEKEKEALAATAQALATRGKGILAADESTRTIGKRLESAGLTNSAETRRAYREVLLSPPRMGEWLGGVILFEETLLQATSDGVPFAKLLRDKGVLPGVKTDKGLDPIPSSPRETTTKGMDTLLERSKRYFEQGARFAKWRATIRIDEEAGLPTTKAIQANASQLAQYAVISQAAGLTPIVEPEILIEGTHSPELFAEVSERVLGAVYGALSEANVYLEGTVLKPQMIMAGVDAPEKKASPQRTAELTLRTLRRRVPPAVPGVFFLSGGQSEEEATVNLDVINRMADADPDGKHPWSMSFSFGRSLQASVLKIWAGRRENFAAAVEMAGLLAKANASAQLGVYEGPHPSICGCSSLHETNRGWRPPDEEIAGVIN
ncbi:unnamed protein product [Sphacelaria rigidula]